MGYRTVKKSFWTDPKIRALSSDEKLLFLYLVTSPHSHYAGIYYLPVSFMIEETGLSQKILSQCLTNLETRLLIRYDKDTSTIFVIKMFKHQNSTGGNPKVIQAGLEKQLKNIHSHVLLNFFIEEYQYLNITLPEGCVKVDTTLCQGTVLSTALSPDTDQSPDQSTATALLSEKPEFEEIIKDLNNKTGKEFRHTSKQTRAHIQSRWNDGFRLEDFKKVHATMTAKWLTDPKMAQYLRPETLYSPKFEGYLNSKVTLSDQGIVSEKTEKGLFAIQNWLDKKEKECEKNVKP